METNQSATEDSGVQETNQPRKPGLDSLPTELRHKILKMVLNNAINADLKGLPDRKEKRSKVPYNLNNALRSLALTCSIPIIDDLRFLIKGIEPGLSRKLPTTALYDLRRKDSWRNLANGWEFMMDHLHELRTKDFRFLKDVVSSGLEDLVTTGASSTLIALAHSYKETLSLELTRRRPLEKVCKYLAPGQAARQRLKKVLRNGCFKMLHKRTVEENKLVKRERQSGMQRPIHKKFVD